MRDTRVRVRTVWAAGAGLVVLGLVLGAPGRALADGGGGGGGAGGGGVGSESSQGLSAARQDPAYVEGVKAVKRGDWPDAIRLMQAVIAKDGKNADAYNWLAYATRQQGDAAKAIPLYEKALAIDPKHRGAHEYMGEAYLVLGDLPRAKEHLAQLDKLCLFSCEEYRDLKKAVQAYETSGGQIKPTSKRAP
jgi:tetratricopeptide (TPR) repeat protein